MERGLRMDIVGLAVSSQTFARSCGEERSVMPRDRAPMLPGVEERSVTPRDRAPMLRSCLQTFSCAICGWLKPLLFRPSIAGGLDSHRSRKGSPRILICS
mmetsp:Transcript_32109/g.84784  ORF Transcript_32109/g.84784 Transcript_32109/m.84784 type:complete len:100 (+) Transcript_32109:3-302(+)